MVGEINQAFDGFHAQVATLCRWALVQRYQRVCNVSDIDAAHVQVQVHPLACVALTIN